MPLDLNAITSAIETHAATTGLFDRINGRPAVNNPGRGVSVTVWPNTIGPVLPSSATGSGLTTTSALVVVNARIYSAALTEPTDGVDPNILTAASALIAAYTADFELGIPDVRCVDLLGMAGTPLSAAAAYLTQSGRLYRVMTIMIPVIVNDVWPQAP